MYNENKSTQNVENGEEDDVGNLSEMEVKKLIRGGETNTVEPGDIYLHEKREVPVERFEPSTLSGLVFETSAYTVPPHRLSVRGTYNNASVVRSQVVNDPNYQENRYLENTDADELTYLRRSSGRYKLTPRYAGMTPGASTRPVGWPRS
jgi:hypothetical protein